MWCKSHGITMELNAIATFEEYQKLKPSNFGLEREKELFEIMDKFLVVGFECHAILSKSNEVTLILKHNSNTYGITVIRGKSYIYHDERTKIVSKWGRNILSFEDKIEAPKPIGKPTKKNVMAWIEYQNGIIEKALSIIAEREKNVSEFLAKLPIDAKTFSKDGKIYKGNLTRNGLTFSFEIENGWITQKIEVEASKTIDNFIALSDNQYKK